MDKEIPENQRRLIKIKRVAKIVAIPAVAVVGTWLMLLSGGKSVRASSVKFATADKGIIHSSVTAIGKVKPALEEIIVSPITSRIVAVYCRPGQQVEKGTPLLKLDLTSAELDLSKAGDQLTMKRLELERRRLNNDTRISDLEMQLKVKEMETERLAADLDNERYLDSIGSGTGEKVRQAETALSTSRMQLKQLRSQIGNERREKAADAHSGEVELEIMSRDMSRLRKTFDDARILSPRQASLTFINNKLGSAVSAGEHIATIADLDHFKVEGTVADAYLDRIAVGSKVSVKASDETLSGIISNIEPSSVNGEVALSVSLDNDSCVSLRTGMKADINIFTDVLPDVIRVSRFKQYSKPGIYQLYVKIDDSTLELRKVVAGAANVDYIEIVSVLKPGDVIVTDDLSGYNSKTLKIK